MYLNHITPLFILGLPRSGTTLLQALLDGHPQLLVDVADSRFFYRYYPQSRRKSWSQKVALAEREMISYIFNENSPYYRDFLSHISIHDLRSRFLALLTEGPLPPKAVLEAYFLALGEASGMLTEATRYWVDKSPMVDFFMQQRHCWWPNAFYIHMIRDPRDMYASYKTRDLRAGRRITPVDSLAYSWKRSVHTGYAYRKIIGERRYLIVKYEDLVLKPEDTIKRIVEFLDIEDSDILRHPTKGHGTVPWGGNPADGVKQKKIYTSAIGRWKSQLSDREVMCIEGLLRKEMQMASYSLSRDPDTIPKYLIYVLYTKNLLREIKHRVSQIGL